MDAHNLRATVAECNGFPLCCSCRTPLDPKDTRSVREVSREDMQKFVAATRPFSGYVGDIQNAVLEHSRTAQPPQSTLLTCKKCQLFTQRFIAAHHAGKSTAGVHPIFDAICYMCSAAASTCAEKRNILSVARNLARKVVFPVGHPLYPHGCALNNELVVHGHPVLRLLIAWVQDGRVPTDNIEDFEEGCIASWYLVNGCCAWGGSRDIMRNVRALRRRQAMFGTCAEVEENEG